MSRLLWLVTALLAVFVAARSVADDTARNAAALPGDGGDAQAVAKGKALYARHCSHCHGFNMVNPGTISYDLRQFPHDDKPRFVQSVIYGKNGRMPQWGDALSLDDIDDLWAYVRTGGRQ
jgi:mono/diheme cytochrome c family protein